MIKKLTIATRGSKLALWQADFIRSALCQQYGSELSISLLILKTKGDIILDVPLAKVGGKGLFVKEIEDALLTGKADIAVHSMKDVPMELPVGLTLGAMPKREDATDLLLSMHYQDIDTLPRKALVGTSSLRRQAQLLSIRPDLEIVSLRGNIDTRLRKLQEEKFDAIVMASAGVKRLGLSVPFMTPLEPAIFLPAVGQGALGIEYLEEREDIRTLINFLDDFDTRACVTAERSFLRTLEGGCQVPIAAYASFIGEESRQNQIKLKGLVSDPKGNSIVMGSLEGDASVAIQLGQNLACQLKDQGASFILEEFYKVEK